MFKIIIRIERKKKTETSSPINNEESTKKMADNWVNDYWPKLQKAKDDSESKLEKYLFTVSTGAVGLLLGTMGFIKKPNNIELLFCGFGSFAMAMLICIVYHFIAMSGHNKQFNLIEKLNNNIIKDDAQIRKDIGVRNKALFCLYFLSLLFIIAGMVLFIIYLSKNIQ